MNEADIKFMREALRVARKGLGRTSPNPAVGAVIVREGVIVARGYHRKAGLPHAEVEALNKLGGKAPGTTLYVTLEPCNHKGKTPPCTQAILASGIKRVVVGMEDPNPNVSGGGLEFLREHGVEVKCGILETECRRLIEAFVKFITQRRPFVILKSALTMDGWTATATGQSKWITSEKSRRFVHGLRHRVDALMVGVGTVVADNPCLTTRFRRGGGHDPLRIIVDTRLRVPLDAKVLNHDCPAKTLFAVGSHVPALNLKRVRNKGASTIVCPTKKDKVDLGALLDALGERSICSLLVEGGAGIVGSLLRERLIDKFYIFKAPKIFGGDDGVPMASGSGPSRMDQCLRLRDVTYRRFEEDILVEAYADYQ